MYTSNQRTMEQQEDILVISPEIKIMEAEDDTNVCIVDEKDSLKLYCYKTCKESDGEDLKSQRSIVKDAEGNVVATSLPFTDEYVVDEDFQAPQMVLEDYVAYPSIEGTLLRVFFHDTWNITTNRKLDAFKSYWSSHFSFGQLFVNNIFTLYKETTMESFYHRLDKSKIYFFLLRPTIESRIVCNIDPTKPALYFVGSLAKDNLSGPLEMVDENLSQLPRMESIQFDSVDTLTEYVRKIDCWEYQGVILFHKEKNQQMKFIQAQYKKFWTIRNNNPNLFLRYFEVRQDVKMLEDFFKLYPKFIVIADKFEAQIFEVSKYLHQAYIDRYIRKQYVSLPKQEYVLLKKAHDWHNEDRNFNRMYRHKMLSLINEEKPIHLYQIVKRHFKY